MKILHVVEKYSPEVGGMQAVVQQLSERLVCLGHDVTVATSQLKGRAFSSLNGVDIEEFSVRGNYAQGISGEMSWFQKFVKEGGFDVVCCFAAQQWGVDALLPIMDEIPGVRVFVPTGFSNLYDPAYAIYYSEMPKWLRSFDWNIFLSGTYRDYRFAEQHGVENCSIIPNGASPEEFSKLSAGKIRKKLGIPDNHFLVLHVGSHTGAKGHRESLQIFQRSGLRRATFLLVGDERDNGCTRACRWAEQLSRFNLGRLFENRKIIVRELSRQDTLAAYASADVFLFTSNVECSPLVLFEAMASKTPVLTTDVGNSAEIVEEAKNGIVLPTSKDKQGWSWVNISEASLILKKIFQDSTLRRTMAQNGYEAWNAYYRWDVIAKKYEELYLRLHLGKGPKSNEKKGLES